MSSARVIGCGFVVEKSCVTSNVTKSGKDEKDERVKGRKEIWESPVRRGNGDGDAIH